MRLIFQIVAIIALAWLALVLVLEGRSELASEAPDHSRIIMIFGGVVLLAVLAGSFVALSLLPALGDKVAGMLFNPSEQVEKDPHADAMARMAQGNYEGAVTEYAAAFERDPEDTLSLSEMARLYCEKLSDPASAERVLEEALGREWSAEDGAFIAMRLVDVRWNYLHDALGARNVLVQVAETMPDTKHAANAHHRLREIDNALAAEDSPLAALPPAAEAPCEMAERPSDDEEAV